LSGTAPSSSLGVAHRANSAGNMAIHHPGIGRRCRLLIGSPDPWRIALCWPPLPSLFSREFIQPSGMLPGSSTDLAADALE
jgi:hypothetical protein